MGHGFHSSINKGQYSFGWSNFDPSQVPDLVTVVTVAAFCVHRPHRRERRGRAGQFRQRREAESRWISRNYHKSVNMTDWLWHVMTGCCIFQWIGLRENKNNRKPSIFLWHMGVSYIFSHQSIDFFKIFYIIWPRDDPDFKGSWNHQDSTHGVCKDGDSMQKIPDIHQKRGWFASLCWFFPVSLQHFSNRKWCHLERLKCHHQQNMWPFLNSIRMVLGD